MTRPDGPAARVRHGVRRHRLRQVPRSDPAPTQVALFPDDPAPPDLDCEVVQVRLSGLRPSRRERGQSPLERAFLTQPWSIVRERVDVKLLARDEDVYILARSRGCQAPRFHIAVAIRATMVFMAEHSGTFEVGYNAEYAKRMWASDRPVAKGFAEDDQTNRV